MRITRIDGLLLFLSLMVPLLQQAIWPFSTIVLASPNYRIDKEFSRLKQTIEGYGFRLVLEPPPRRNTYGLFEVKTKTIWVNPVVFSLGNAQATLVHEAVHAAQYCANGHPLYPLGISISKNRQLRPFYTRYRGIRRQLEAEAYTIQIHPKKVSQAIALLHQHCQ